MQTLTDALNISYVIIILAVIAIALVAIFCLLWRALMGKPKADATGRRRLTRSEVEKILLVAQDGPDLLAIMDKSPGAGAAIVDGVYDQRSSGEIFAQAMNLIAPMNDAESETGWHVRRAIAQAQKLYDVPKAKR